MMQEVIWEVNIPVKYNAKIREIMTRNTNGFPSTPAEVDL